jgi:hypothetical protein
MSAMMPAPNSWNIERRAADSIELRLGRLANFERIDPDRLTMFLSWVGRDR